MRTRPAGGGDRRRPRCRDAGHDRRLRLLAPRGPAHHARPERGQHGPVRVHGARRPGQADRRLELGPAAEPGRRAVLRQARSRAARYYVKIDNTGDGVEDVAYRWEFKNKFRNPGSFLYAVPPVNSINDPNLNFVQTYDLYYERYRNGKRGLASGGSRKNVPVAPDNVGPKTMPNYAAVAAGATRNLPGGGKSSSAPPMTRSSSTSARSSTASTSTSPAARRSASATRAAARTTSRATTSTRSSLQVPAVRGHARRARRLRRRGARTPSSASGRPPSARRSRSTSAATRKERWVQVSRLGNPLINEVIIPIGLKDKYNATSPDERPEELRRRRAEPRAGADPQRAVQARHQGDRPHGHRPGAADRHPRPDADLAQRRPGRHAEVQPRRARRPRTRTASACSPVTPAASRTAAGWPTT